MKRIHVVAAVIHSAVGAKSASSIKNIKSITNIKSHNSIPNQLLIARRPDHLHQGGLWEFPGGKVETGEQPRQALVRELKEELDIQVTACEPFMQVSHDYTDKQVLLDIWRVTAFEGEARGMEGQDCRWVALTDLLLPDSDYAFPAATQGILDRLALGL
jgi:8-oxo-dGTP diphosphatase